MVATDDVKMGALSLGVYLVVQQLARLCLTV